MDIERLTLEEWGDALPRSGIEVFHDPDALAVLDAHTDAEMRLYGAYKGQQAVGLLPVFVDQKSVGRTVFSPPLSLGVPRLGPVINRTARNSASGNGSTANSPTPSWPTSRPTSARRCSG